MADGLPRVTLRLDYSGEGPGGSSSDSPWHAASLVPLGSLVPEVQLPLDEQVCACGKWQALC